MKKRRESGLKTHQVDPKQRKGNDKERIQTKYPSPPLAKASFAKPVIRQQRKGLQWRKLGLPASTLMFKKTLTHSSDHEQQPETPSTVAVVPSDSSDTHFACDASIDVYKYGHSKRTYRYRYQWLWTKLRQRHVNLPKLRHGNVWNSDGGHKDPPPPPNRVSFMFTPASTQILISRNLHQLCIVSIYSDISRAIIGDSIMAPGYIENKENNKKQSRSWNSRENPLTDVSTGAVLGHLEENVGKREIHIQNIVNWARMLCLLSGLP